MQLVTSDLKKNFKAFCDAEKSQVNHIPDQMY